MKTKLILAGCFAALIQQLATPAFGQGTSFTYQGLLNDGASPANGSYDLTFALFAASSAGAQQGNSLTNTATTVSNGLFTVTLDFGNQFPGADRWLEVGVRTNGGGAFTTLAPRQQVTAAPYAIQAANASTAASASTATTATNFSGSLSGNVTGPQAATVVSTVGGVTAANVASGANLANAATSANTPNAIVRRDAGGSFSAESVTLAGNLNLPATTASAGIIKIGGANALHTFGGNTFAGPNAGNTVMIGNQNTGIGFSALNANTSGTDNTANGSLALTANTQGGANTAVGASALNSNTTGNHNTAVGAYTLGSNTNGIRNTATGAEALFANTSGSGNTANGMLAMRFNTSGSDNTAIGGESLLNNLTGSENTAVGVDALHNNTIGSVNTAIGRRALYSNTNGVNNTASGWGALQNNNSGSENTANGVNALGANSTGSENTAAGFNALVGNTSGTGNTASGYHALSQNGNGTENTANGAYALFKSTGGSRNTSVGYYSLGNIIGGSNNIALGDHAGSAVTNGNQNIFIGADAVGDVNRVIRIGAGQTNTFIAGISGTPVADGEVVVVNSSGQLGTTSAVGVWGSSGGNVYRTNGFVGIGTASPTHYLHIAAGVPTIALQDTNAASLQAGYMSYRDNGNVERAWVGYGTAGSPDFSIVNARTSGDIVLLPLAGNVGINTATPAAMLDVRGDIRLGNSGQFFAVKSPQNDRTLRGTVGGTGAIVAGSGSGFTITQTATGRYTINFSQAFTAAPTVIVTSLSAARQVNLNTTLTTGVGIQVTDLSGVDANGGFTFIVMGQ